MLRSSVWLAPAQRAAIKRPLPTIPTIAPSPVRLHTYNLATPLGGKRLWPIHRFDMVHADIKPEHILSKHTRPMVTTTTRKHEDSKSSADALRALLSSAINDHGSVEIALLHMMHKHDFDWNLLQQVLSGPSILFLFIN